MKFVKNELQISSNLISSNHYFFLSVKCFSKLRNTPDFILSFCVFIEIWKEQVLIFIQNLCFCGHGKLFYFIHSFVFVHLCLSVFCFFFIIVIWCFILNYRHGWPVSIGKCLTGSLPLLLHDGWLYMNVMFVANKFFSLSLSHTYVQNAPKIPVHFEALYFSEFLK